MKKLNLNKVALAQLASELNNVLFDCEDVTTLKNKSFDIENYVVIISGRFELQRNIYSQVATGIEFNDINALLVGEFGFEYFIEDEELDLLKEYTANKYK